MLDHCATSAVLQTLPACIAQTLHAAGISFSLAATDTIDPRLHLHQVLLEHLDQQLLVIIPRTHILDLAKLNRLTDTKWRAASKAHIIALLAPLHLDHLPALPQLFKLDSLCDPAIFKQPQVYIDSGVTGFVIGLSAAALNTLLADSQRIRCAEAILQQHPNNSAVTGDAEQIQNAVVQLTARRIHQRLEETLDIPLLNSTAQKILRLRNDPLAGVDELAAIVETDPALAAQVISWAASPYYASPSKIRSVEDAIVRVLGFDLVINLALGLALGKSLTVPTEQPQHCQPYWQQAIYTAALLEGLTRHIAVPNKPEPGLAYLAGLLHNFGFALLAHLFPPHYALLCRSLEANIHLTNSAVEHHVLGITREQMGAWLMQCWHIPEELIYALRYQDNLDYQGKHATYANLTCLAQRLLMQHKNGLMPNNTIPTTLYQRLSLTEENAQLALQQVFAAEHALRALAAQFTH